MGEPEAKKSKKESEEKGADAAEELDLADLSSFKLKRVLNENSERKEIFLEGRFQCDEYTPAVLILGKPPFASDALPSLLNAGTKLEKTFRNDVYYKFDAMPDPRANLLKAQVIYPATAKHLAKYESHPMHIIYETPALFRTVTEPFLQGERFDIEWVYNILAHKKEAESIVFENPDPDEGFIMVPDYKWNGKQIEDLYLVALVHTRSIRSIRDLRAEHLPLLKNLWNQGCAAIKEKYGLPPSQIRAYFHYQPTYFHLHAHFTHLAYRAPGSGVEKAHLLPTVIGNISREGSNFYGRATLPFAVKESDKLYQEYKKAGYAFHEDASSRQQRSEEELEGLTRFFMCLGQAKHEPCGEHWDATYAETAWRMAVAALCLPPGRCNRARLVRVALSSALTCVGSRTDHCSEWKDKLGEVRQYLMANLPLEKAAELYELFLTHANCRRKKSFLKDSDEDVYARLLEFEEALLMQEELRREGENLPASAIYSKMCDVGFPGCENYKLFGDASQLKAILAFLLQVSTLMTLKRTGWVDHKVRDPERVAGHMFRMALMAVALEDEETVVGKDVILGGSAAVVSLLHDVPECIVGDLNPAQTEKVTKEEKHRMEMEAMKKLSSPLPGPLAKETFDAFARYEEQREGDAEARIAKDLDKYDMILQAFEYEAADRSRGRFLEDFFASTKNWFQTEAVRSLVGHLSAKREAMHAAAVSNGNNSA